MGLNLTLRVWRQGGPNEPGGLVTYEANDISPDMSFLEMLDVVNEGLVKDGKEPIAFDHDCREGICGSCGMLVDGIPHGPIPASTVCQLFMRHFEDGQTIVVEPWRAAAFPIVKDLIVDRTAFDRVQAAGGYVSVDTGGVPDGNDIPIPKAIAEEAMDAATCIGCGACVAACKNASAALFTGARVTQFSLLPQGQAERERRVIRMVDRMETEGFGACTNEAECEAVCPKEIATSHITRMNWEYARAIIKGGEA